VIRIRFSLALGVALAVGVGGARAAGGPGGDRAAGRPASPVLVVVVVDQLAAWIAAERWPLLPPDGGFARLRREGLYVEEMRYGHASTETAAGHSALFSGAPPHDSGIYANDVIPAPGAGPVSFLGDATSREIGPPGVDASGKSSSSLSALRVETLGDALERARPSAQVIALSLKDRGALFAGGRHPTAALWLDNDLASFVTSTAVARAFPAWAAKAGGPSAVHAAMAAPWQLGDRAWVETHAQTPDDGPGESSYKGLGRTFPHPIESAKALRMTPGGDALLFGLAEAAAAELAAHGGGGLLALSLSSNDYIAHLFGPHSWEAWDELARLDRGLAAFLTRLDAIFGADGYALMLTADHGSNALPEVARAAPSPWCPAAGGRPDRWQRSCGPRRRLLQAEVVTALEEALDRKLGRQGGRVAGPLVAGIAEPLLFLTPRARALGPADRRILVREATRVLEQQFGLAHVVDVRAVPGHCPPLADESWRALVCRSIRADGPGDLYLVPAPGSFFDPRLDVGAGTNHGSPYLYDRAVPLVVRAPGRVPAGKVLARPVPFTAFARTAAELLDIPPPAAAARGETLVR
jgi:hypothetical protein